MIPDPALTAQNPRVPPWHTQRSRRFLRFFAPPVTYTHVWVRTSSVVLSKAYCLVNYTLACSRLAPGSRVAAAQPPRPRASAVGTSGWVALRTLRLAARPRDTARVAPSSPGPYRNRRRTVCAKPGLFALWATAAGERANSVAPHCAPTRARPRHALEASRDVSPM